MEEVELYLHAIELRPLYPRPDHSNNRKLVFYNLLKRSDGFAILSSKMMPKVCSHQGITLAHVGSWKIKAFDILLDFIMYRKMYYSIYMSLKPVALLLHANGCLI